MSTEPCAADLVLLAGQCFRAMQFNPVVSTHVAAVRLWQRLGFSIVGTLPEAFRHPANGYEDACVMSQRLSPAPTAGHLLQANEHDI